MIKKIFYILLCIFFIIETVTALPVTGWQQQYGINLVGADTDSPAVGQAGSGDGGQCILWASFDEIALLNTGDSIKLSFNWTLTGASAGKDFFRYGIFDANGSSTQGDWLGYKVWSEGVFEQNGTGGGDFGSISSYRGSNLLDSSPALLGAGGENCTYSFELTIIKVDTGLLISSGVAGSNGYSYTTSVVDETPQWGNTPIVYNRVGLCQTGSTAPDMVEFSAVDVKAYASMVSNPVPNNEAIEQLPDIQLSWAPLSDDIVKYDVYIRANEPTFIPVNNFNDSYYSSRQLENTFSLPINLAFDTTYYWRVDTYKPNLNGTGFTLAQGQTWSLTTRPEYDYQDRSVADFNGDDIVDNNDFEMFVDDWLLPAWQRVWKATPYGPGTDIDKDGNVNMLDFSYFSLEWLSTTPVLSLPTVFTDNMVLQQGKTLPVWGNAVPGAAINVQFGLQEKTGVADENGDWRVELSPLVKSNIPRSLLVTSQGKSITINNVLVGEVWFCSGQSNMEWIVSRCHNADTTIATANYPQIRIYSTPRAHAGSPQSEIDSQWQVCSPETIKDFSAVAYFFGKKLHNDLDVPVGLLLSSWGGTKIEPWTPACGFEGIDTLADINTMVRKTLPYTQEYNTILNNYLEEYEQWELDNIEAIEDKDYITAPPAFPQELILSDSHQTATRLFNGMVYGHVPFAIRGAIWYQGEANHNEGMLYVDKTRALLQGWRKLWGYDFPYYFVQIAPYQYGSEHPEILPEFWEAQGQIVNTIPNTGMAVVSDYTMLNDIHPRNKEVPGERLALLAEANTYDMDVICTGPIFKDIEIIPGAIKVYFDVADGLTTNNGQSPDWFEVAGESREFKSATAYIDGNAVVVESEAVSEPLVVRFAWHKLATPNLVNKAGIPAATFRAGEFPPPNNPALSRVPEAEGFSVIYQLDIPSDADYKTNEPEYLVDNSDRYESFDKIGYFLELTDTDDSVSYVFVSMDKFTDDLKKISLPILSSNSYFFQKVDNITVRSNVAGVSSCTEFDGGNIEFCPGNYQTNNSNGITGALDDVYDFGDNGVRGEYGYGSMQVHNWKMGQTVFAINRWGGEGPIDVGIGSSSVGNPDWTFRYNGPEYKNIRLTIMIK